MESDEEEKDEWQHGLGDWRRGTGVGDVGGEEDGDDGGGELDTAFGVTSPGRHEMAFILNEDQWAVRPPRWALAQEESLYKSAHAAWPSSQRGMTTHTGAGRIDEQPPSSPPAPKRPAQAQSHRSRSSPPDSPPAKAVAKKPDKKRGRTCKADGCNNYIVYNGLCCRHGGGKKCSADGCESSAKHKGRCWRHGGSVECKRLGCTKRAKARGLCWGHGGGTPCSTDGCEKVSVSNGLCWAHGGGKRCIYDGCQRPAYTRTHDFCKKHYEELKDVDYYEV